jgi:hypothetical protein
MIKVFEDVEIISNYKDLNPNLKQDPYAQEAANVRKKAFKI